MKNFWATDYLKQANEVSRYLVRNSDTGIPGTPVTPVRGFLKMIGAAPSDPRNPAHRAEAVQKIRTFRTIAANEGSKVRIAPGMKPSPGDLAQAAHGTAQVWNKIVPTAATPA